MARLVWTDNGAYDETGGYLTWTDVGAYDETSGAASFVLVAATSAGQAAAFTFSIDKSVTLVASTGTGAVHATVPTISVPLGAVAATGAVVDFIPDTGIFGAVAAAGAVRPFAILEQDPLYAAAPAVTAFGAFTVSITSPATLIAVQAFGAVGQFIVQVVNPTPSPEPGPPLSPVIVSPVHFLNWVWPLTRRGHNAPPITNGIMLEDGTGAILLEDSTPLLLE
jgi:hypothetical protein